MSRIMSNKPPITVLMSVYNGERWLPEAIESVLNQTFSKFEFIIVNDGSTDSSLDIIQKYASYDKRIKVLNKTNSGLADSLNKGIAISNGAWIARIDADDICEVDRLEIQYEVAQSESDLVLVGSWIKIVDKFGSIKKIYRYPSSHEKLVERLLSEGAFFAHSSVLYKTQIVKSLGGYRLRIKRAQDWDLWLRLSEVGKITCVDRALVRIRKHDDQISHEEQGKRQLIYATIAIISYWIRRNNLPDPVNCLTDAEFQKFWRFVENEIRAFFNFHQRKFLFKADLDNASNIIKKFCRLFSFFLKSPSFPFIYLYYLMCTKRIIKNLAFKWFSIGGKAGYDT